LCASGKDKGLGLRERNMPNAHHYGESIALSEARGIVAQHGFLFAVEGARGVGGAGSVHGIVDASAVPRKAPGYGQTYGRQKDKPRQTLDGCFGIALCAREAEAEKRHGDYPCCAGQPLFGRARGCRCTSSNRDSPSIAQLEGYALFSSDLFLDQMESVSYIAEMNWDWDKLQEKRQRQGKKPAPPDDLEGGLPTVDLGKYLPKRAPRLSPGLLIAGALLLWLASGIFIVNPGESAVVTRFGAYNREVGEGPHIRLPFPMEADIVENTMQLRSIEIGQPSDATGKNTQSRSDESSMFTGDENIVHMHFRVQFSIDNLRQYLFNVKAPTQVVAAAAEATMREVVGASLIDDILTAERASIQDKARQELQKILNSYGSGIRVHEVQLLDVQPPAEVGDAFKDVASAREDKVRIINQAEAYRNEIVPVATGTAKSMINAAAAYKQQVELGAKGEASRFLAMTEEYAKNREATRKRLYYEAMGDIFSSPGMEKFVISKDAGSGMLPLFNLDGRLPPKPSAPAAPATPAAGAKR
jgi:membrane protease subunit HflK